MPERAQITTACSPVRERNLFVVALSLLNDNGKSLNLSLRTEAIMNLHGFVSLLALPAKKPKHYTRQFLPLPLQHTTCC